MKFYERVRHCGDMPVIIAFGKLMQEDQKFKDSLGYVALPFLKIKVAKNKTLY